MKKIQQKLIVGTLLISLLLPQITLAQAAVVTDPGLTGVASGGVTQDAVGITQQILTISKEYGLDTLAYTLAQTAGAKLGNKVFNKANGGASGDDSQPSFISNFNNYFADLDRSTIQKYVSQLEVTNSPFAQDIAKGMIFAYSASGGKGIPDAIGGFNLNTVIGENYKDFYEDASVGGYSGLLAMSIPGNTAIGAQMEADQRIAKAIQQARDTEDRKLTSTGVLPQGECTMDFGTYAQQVKQIKAQRGDYVETNQQQTDTGEDTTVLQMAKDRKIEINKQIEDILDNQREMNDRILNELIPAKTQAESVGDTIKAGQIQMQIDILKVDINNYNKNLSSLTAELSDVNDIAGQVKDLRNVLATNTGALVEDFGRCLSEVIKNPLSLVSSGLTQATGYAMDQLKQADELGEILGGIFLNLFNTFVQNGLSSLRADFSQSSETGSVGGPEDLRNSNNENISWTQGPQIIVDLKSDFNPALKNTQSEVDSILKYFNTITGSAPIEGSAKSFPQTIVDLDVCIPGPDYDFLKRFDDYINVKTSKLQRKMNSGSENKQDVRSEVMSLIDEATDLAKSDIEIWSTDSQRNIPGASIMKSEIENLTKIRQIYTRKKSDILERQTALNVLIGVEGQVRASLNKLPTGTIPENIKLIAPFSEISWNKLTTQQRETLTTWAKTENTSTQVIILQTSTEQFKFVTNVLWDIWENPTGYIPNTSITNWDERSVPKISQVGIEGETETTYLSPAQDFTDTKNKIRSEFNSISDKFSTPYSMTQSTSDYINLVAIMKKITNLLKDCTTIRRMVKENDFRGNKNNPNPNAHQLMLDYFNNNKDKFVTDEIKNSFLGSSILQTAPQEFPSGMNCSNNVCKNTIEIKAKVDDDDDNKVKREFNAINSNNTRNQYQVPAARNVWEVVEQDPGSTVNTTTQFMCPFIKFLSYYDTVRYVKGDPISCSSSWYRVSTSVISSYLFRSNQF